MKIHKVIHRYHYIPGRTETRLLVMKADDDAQANAAIDQARREVNQNQRHIFFPVHVSPLNGCIMGLAYLPGNLEINRLAKYTKDEVDTFLGVWKIRGGQGQVVEVVLYLVVVDTLAEAKAMLRSVCAGGTLTVHPIKLEGLTPLYHWYEYI